jgi:glucose-1-phosphate thymidylyltransferase
MKIVLPMAGYGTRMRPHTWSKPKPLIGLAGSTVLGHILDMLQTLESIDEAIFIVGYLGDQIEDYVQRAYPALDARFVVQDELIGQSHALWLAREYLRGPILMVFVDTIIETDLAFLKSERADAVIWVKEVSDPRRFGVAEVGPDGWVRRLVEKPKDTRNNLAVVGFYYFQDAERLLRAIEEQLERGSKLKGEYFLADAIQILLDQGLKMRVETVEVWKDCGKPDALLETNRYLLDNGRDNTSIAQGRRGIVVRPPVFIHPEADIRASIIGPHASIEAGCTVENSIIRDSVIEAGARIIDSLLTSSLIGRSAAVEGKFHALNIGDSADVCSI